MPPLSSREAIIAGIRPDANMSRDAKYLYDARNLRPDRFGMKPFYELWQPWTDLALGGIGTKTYPFPMLISGRNVSLLCFETSIFLVDYAANTLTELHAKNAADTSGATSFSIPSGGGAWQFIDLGNTWALMNGSCFLFKYGTSGVLWGSSAVTVKAGCSFKYRRAFLGGFKASDMYSLVDWPSILGGASNAPEELQSLLNDDGFTPNTVWWSSWGAADLFFLFQRAFMIYASDQDSPDTGFSEEDPFYRELAMLNESGSTVMPWDGDVSCVKEFGNGAISYGSLGATSYVPGGVTALVPVGEGAGRGFGLRPIQDFPDGLGLAGRGAIAGTKSLHGFIAEDGELYVISDYTARRIGHGEIFSEFLENEIVMAYDQKHQDFWITDGTACYVRTPTGLSKAPWMPTSISFHGSAMAAIYFPDPVSSTEVLMVSEKATVSPDGAARVIEYLKHVGKRHASHAVQFALDYKVDTSKDWTRTAFKDVDIEGQARFDLLVVEYRWVLKCDSRLYVSLEDVQVGMGDGMAQGASWPSSSTSPATE